MTDLHIANYLISKAGAQFHGTGDNVTSRYKLRDGRILTLKGSDWAISDGAKGSGLRDLNDWLRNEPVRRQIAIDNEKQSTLVAKQATASKAQQAKLEKVISTLVDGMTAAGYSPTVKRGVNTSWGDIEIDGSERIGIDSSTLEISSRYGTRQKLLSKLLKELEKRGDWETPKAKNPLFMDAFHAGETFAKDRSSSRTPRYASFAEWWKAKGSKDAGAKFFDAEDAKDFWIKGMNANKKKNPPKPSSKAGLPANASAQQIAAKLKQLSSLKALLESKPDRKSHVAAERIAQQMKALAKKLYASGSGLKANPKKRNAYRVDSGNVALHTLPLATLRSALPANQRNLSHADTVSKVRELLAFGKASTIARIEKVLSSKANPSLRGLKAKVSKLAKASLSKAKASLKRLTPSGRRSTAALNRLREASASDPLGKTKMAILEMRKSLKKNPSKYELWKGTAWMSVKGDRPQVASLHHIRGTQTSHSIAIGRYGTNIIIGSGHVSAAVKAVEDVLAENVRFTFIPSAKPTAKNLGKVVKRSTLKANPKRKHGPKMKKRESKTTSTFLRAKIQRERALRKPNGSDASAELYEKFHGKPSSSILEIEEQWHIHKNLAQLGTLVEIKVLLNPTESKTNQRRATLAVPNSDNAIKGVQLCSSEGSKRSKTLYLVGGDQSLPLKALGFTAADEKDLMYIGEVEEITYRTRKHFDQFKRIDYYHGLGEVSKVKPQLLYRSRDKKLLIAGGQYDVRPEGIVN